MKDRCNRIATPANFPAPFLCIDLVLNRRLPFDWMRDHGWNPEQSFIEYKGIVVFKKTNHWFKRREEMSTCGEFKTILVLKERNETRKRV